ncbi:MAG: xanthine dehydrogenase family protein molybdopterin-binding subunit [Ekhidna sp.]
MKEQTRREFLKISTVSGAGLLVGLHLFQPKYAIATSKPEVTPFNAFISIDSSGKTILYAKNPEIGQGVKTSLPMILAEELCVQWDQIRVEQKEVDSAVGYQHAGGSMSVATNYDLLRSAGAAVRELMESAAARKWKVDSSDCMAKDGMVYSGSFQISYGDLVEEAKALPLPSNPKLKNSNDFNIIGTSRKDVDIQSIVTGKPLFGIDQELGGMVYASIIKPEIFGSKVGAINAEELGSRRETIDIIKIDGSSNPTILQEGVAVVGRDTWSVFKAKKLINVEWTHPSDFVKEVKEVSAALKAKIDSGRTLRSDGDVDTSFSLDEEIIESMYEVPFISHSQMEPMNFIADVKKNSVYLCGPTQMPVAARQIASSITGITQANVKVEFTRIGGGFGRRLLNDYVAEAVTLSKQLERPVKIVWTREDDFLGDYYRPYGCYKFKGGIRKGKLNSLEVKIATLSRYIYAQRSGPSYKTEAFPDQQPAGMIPNFRISYASHRSNVPLGALRTPGVNATTFGYQCFLDEIAEKLGKDAIDFHLELIGNDRMLPYGDHGGPMYDTRKLKNVIELVRKKSNWDSPQKDLFYGFAAQMVFGTYVAEVVSLTVDKGKIKVHEVTAAVDCGIVVNPTGAEAQVAGGIVDALSVAFYESISLEEGKLRERNFDSYRKLRNTEAPEVNVHFVSSDDNPQGLGEPSYPVLFPALCNAVYRATGRRVYKLPLRDLGLV